jgi:hypothetical protein
MSLVSGRAKEDLLNSDALLLVYEKGPRRWRAHGADGLEGNFHHLGIESFQLGRAGIT